jgi:hypothetical protein
MRGGVFMKKNETKKLVNIEFEVNDVQAFGLDGIVVPMYCADNYTNGCGAPPSTSTCTSCYMSRGCLTPALQGCSNPTNF